MLICPGTAAGKSQPLQLDVYLAEGRYKSGLVQGVVTYADTFESRPNDIRLTKTIAASAIPPLKDDGWDRRCAAQPRPAF
jgi:hypothetical protein